MPNPSKPLNTQLPEGVEPAPVPIAPPTVNGPSPMDQAYMPSPHTSNTWPGQSLPDSLRQAYGQNTRVIRWWPLSNS